MALLPQEDDTSARRRYGARVNEGLWRRFRRIDPPAWDGVLAGIVLVLALIGVWIERGRTGDTLARSLIGVIFAIGASVPLAWRRRAPLAVAAIVGVCVAGYSVAQTGPPMSVPLVIALYTAAANRERDRLTAVLPGVVLVASVGMFGRDGNWVEILASAVLLCGVPIAYGRVVFNRRARIVRDRETAAREAVLAERARVARELHDVVAHHMSVMVVQAGAARSVLPTDAEAAAEALLQIERSGRNGLAEMRRLLDVLKSVDSADGREPQPGLDSLPTLLAQMRATGLRAEAVVEGTPRPLPVGIDLSAYRIVQEALTNTLKHAGQASARVLVRYGDEGIDLEIADDGAGRPARADGGGHGLIGMRERAQLFGGRLETGEREGGGFVVRAHLPVGGTVDG